MVYHVPKRKNWFFTVSAMSVGNLDKMDLFPAR